VIIAALCLGAWGARGADVILQPGDDLVQAVKDAAAGDTIFLEQGTDDPARYVVDEVLLIDKNLQIRGATSSQPQQIEITGIDPSPDCTGNVIGDPEFEDLDGSWSEVLTPPDPFEPGYTIIQANTAALTPDHLANFKGIAGAETDQRLEQDGVVIPSVEGLDEEITQSVKIPMPVQGMDELTQSDIIFPDPIIGIDDVFLRRPFNNLGPIDFNAARLMFQLARDDAPLHPEDRIEIFFTDGSGAVLTPPRIFGASLLSPNVWANITLTLAPLATVTSPSDTWQLHFKTTTRSTVHFYVDALQVEISPVLNVPVEQGSLDVSTVIDDWQSASPANPLKIVPDTFDATGPGDQCVQIGAPGSSALELRFQFQVYRSSGELSDHFEVLLDGATLLNIPAGPLAPGPGGWATAAVDLAALLPLNQRGPGHPHELTFRSFTTPSADNPDAPDENTTIFIVDDVSLLVGDPLIPDTSPSGLRNGNFDEGPGLEWAETFTWNPPLNMFRQIIMAGPDSTSAPFSAVFGGLPPPKLSFWYKVAKHSGNTDDYLKVYIDDEANLLLDTRAEGDWVEFKRWLIPTSDQPWVDDQPHDLHFESFTSRVPVESTFLVDDVCVAPYGGLGSTLLPDDVCGNNQVLDASFEQDPAHPGWSAKVTVGGVDMLAEISPFACFDPADSTCRAPDVHSGTWVAMFGGLPPVSVRFWLKILNGDATGAGELQVLIDGSDPPVLTVAESDSGYSSYQEVTIPATALTAYADGTGRTLSFVCRADRRDNPVMFLIDDVCISPWGGADPGQTGTTCPNNGVLNPDFEAGHAAWSESPIDGIITQAAAEAHTGDWYARLTGRTADVRRLRQSVAFPAGANTLTFWIWVFKSSGTGADFLQVYIDSPANVLTTIRENDSTATGDWTKVAVDISAYAGGTHDLIIESKTVRNPVASQFLLDSFCLSAGTGQLHPIIQVESGRSFLLRNVAVTGGTTGVLGIGASSITLQKCYLFGLTEGVSLTNVGGASIAQSSVHGCGVGIEAKDSVLTVFQSTLKNNSGYGVIAEGGRANVAACLVWSNGGGLANLTSYHNLVYPDSYSGVTFGGDPSEFRPPDPSIVHFLDSPWVGKLQNVGPLPCPCPIYTALTLGALTGAEASFAGLFSTDFESEVRLQPMQVGADEVNASGGTLSAWTGCAVTPIVPRELTGRAYDIGVGREFTVSIELAGTGGAAGGILYLVPEEYLSVVNADPTPATVRLLPAMLQAALTTPFDPRVGVATFSISATFIQHPITGVEMCVDGRARVYLEMGGQLFGIGTPGIDYLLFDPADTEFIIDTTPPAVAPNYLQSTAAILAPASNDNLIPPPSEGPYPPWWGPALGNPPDSDGTLGAAPPPQIFYNNAPADPLDFSVEMLFWDTIPVDSTLTAHFVQTSGFWTNLAPLSSGAMADAVNVLSVGHVFPDPVTGVAAPVTGVARWMPDGAGLGLLSGAGVSASASMLPTSASVGLPDAGVDAIVQKLEATWLVSNFTYQPGWHFTTRFRAMDLSGNFVETPPQQPLHFWWMVETEAILSSAPSPGVRTADPSFQWSLNRFGGQAPQDSYPCVPLAKFQVWVARDPLLPPESNTWDSLTRLVSGEDWSPWIRENVIDRNTVATKGGLLLEDLLRLSPGALMRLTILGADEAGNVQINVPAEAVWRNPGELRALDTAIHARFWHNRTDTNVGDIARINPELGERDFGSSRRIPIAPANDCNVRIEAGFTIQLVKPDVINPLGDYYADCQLFEDGQLVAVGIVSRNTTTGLLPEILIPQDLLNPGPVTWRDPTTPAFLRNGPNCAVTDRLGDDGDLETRRKRDVEYVFTARTTETYYDPDTGASGVFTDPTPAMVQFTVTVPESRKDEQPIKVFSRE
jgi:hypothetical protein